MLSPPPYSILRYANSPSPDFHPSRRCTRDKKAVEQSEAHTWLCSPSGTEWFPIRDFSVFPVLPRSASWASVPISQASMCTVQLWVLQPSAWQQVQASQNPSLARAVKTEAGTSHLSQAQGTPRSSSPSPCRRGCSSRSAG